MTVISNGTNLINNGALDSGAAVGSLILLATQTASSSSTITFSSGIDSTYKVYVFKFINIHPATDATTFTFQGNAAGGSGYNETMTTTFFVANHDEGDSSTDLSYQTGIDQAQGTSFQRLAKIGNGNDECASGELWLFNLSSTTYVKHFMCTSQEYHDENLSERNHVAGYFNTTSAIDEIQFKMASGNIDSGTIKLYGIA